MENYDKEQKKQMKHLKTCNDLEFCLSWYDEFYKKEGIIRYRTVKHTLQQNSIIERMNRIPLKRADVGY